MSLGFEMKNTCRVAVYGSLKQGFFNHELLGYSTHIDSGFISGFKMFDLELFPAIIRSPNDKIFVEIYEVEADTLADLDELESYKEDDLENSFYKRICIVSRWGPIMLYVYNKSLKNAQEVIGGNWEQ